MKNFKEIAEKCLNGELYGVFVLRNNQKISSKKLLRNTKSKSHPYILGYIYLTEHGTIYNLLCTHDVVDFINMKNKKQIEIPIPEGFELNLQESTKDKAIVQEKDKYPKSWEEYKQLYGDPFKIHVYDHILTNFAYKIDAYTKLMILRREWIHIWSQEQGLKEDWEPNIDSHMFGIIFSKQGIRRQCIGVYVPFSFPTAELAENFMNTFKSLLEQAKGLY